MVRPPLPEHDVDGTTQSTVTVRADNVHGITDSILSIESFHTATGSMFSFADATEGGSTVRGLVDTGIGERALRTEVEGGVCAVADAQIQSSPPPPLLHRFTLIKPGAKRPGVGPGNGGPFPPGPSASSTGSPVQGSPAGPATTVPNFNGVTTAIPAPLWNPFDFFFSSGLLVSRCDLCSKRLGWKPVLECDDCGLR